ncbi:MAG: protease SohB, partial [SAR86 cluster bacterium]
MEYLIQYGVFLAKVITLVVAMIVIIIAIVAASSRQKKSGSKGSIKITRLNDHVEDMRDELLHAVLDDDALKAKEKQDKLKAKAELKEKKALRKKQKNTDVEEPAKKKRDFVLNFDGDIAANAVSSLREEITSILSLADSEDEVILRLESPGGMVHAYGLASSQLERIKKKQIPLTICVDKVAASGGYMMACLADKIVAAPFAILGSIGVILQA